MGTHMLTLDGSAGEGGGQILRTALALALVTGKPFRIEHIRKRRGKPGLLRQHLTCVEAAAAVSGAEVEGAELGSLTLVFRPGPVRPGAYEFAVGTAGSTMLVLQSILPALLVAGAPSALTLHGGTHNPMAPPFEFLVHAFAPVLARMGARLELHLDQPGFHPAGGGRVRAEIAPARLQPVEILQRGEPRGIAAEILLAGLPRHIAEREAQVIRDAELPGPCEVRITEARALCQGNALALRLRFAEVEEVVTTLGERGVPAEAVARRAVAQARAYLQHDAPVGEHLADQLLLPLALAGGGAFKTCVPSSHTRTNAAVIERLLPVRFEFAEEEGGSWRVEVRARQG